MKKLFGMFLVMFTLVLTSLVVFAQVTAPPETVEGATSLIPKLIEGLVAGNYTIVGGIVLMIAMVAVRQYLVPNWKIGAELMPVVTAIMSSLAMAGLSMMNSVPAGEAALNGLVMAVFAGGSWSLIGKYIAKAILGKNYAEPAK